MDEEHQRGIRREAALSLPRNFQAIVLFAIPATSPILPFEQDSIYSYISERVSQ